MIDKLQQLSQATEQRDESVIVVDLESGDPDVIKLVTRNL